MDQTNADTRKRRLRQHYRHQRSLVSAQVEPHIQTAVTHFLRSPTAHQQGGVVGIHWPLPGEIDLRGLHSDLDQPVALPCVEPDGVLSYRPWRASPLSPDGCGIPSPLQEAPLRPEQLTVLLVPALAVDRSGIRLGYGGGYYDRLRANPAWAAIPAWVVLPAACLSDEPLPRDPWDVPFTGWITEQGSGLVDARSAS